MKKIRESKGNKWKELIQQLDEDIWGGAYRTASKQFRGSGAPYKMTKERKRQVIEGLFPNMPYLFNRTQRVSMPDAELFTETEVLEASKKLKRNKASGPDGIPAEVVISLAMVAPGFFTGVLNGLLAQQLFPKDWKLGKLALIPKPGKPLDSPSAYGPICLISMAAKLFEQLVKERLELALEGADMPSEE